MKSIFVFTLSFLLSCFTAHAGQYTVWLGTGGSGAKGIYKTTFDYGSGKLTPAKLAAEVEGPGWITLNNERDRLYAVCKMGEPSVAVWSIDGNDNLTFINSQPIGDGGAAHVSLDKENRILFTAQYGGGSTAAFSLNEDGSIGEQTSLIEHTGSGPNKDRQQGPHPHWTGVSPDNRFLFVPDLGSDKVIIYKIDHEMKTIAPHGFGQTVPGGGPRHMKFNEAGDKIYLLNELLLSVTLFDYDAETGTMEAIQTIENLPGEEPEVPSKSSEIRIHPSGKFVYAANRGHDTLTVFSVDGETGKLSFVENEPIRGSWPRNFNIGISGNWALVGGRYSNTLGVFSINQEDGSLIYSGNVINTPAPICITY